ncbi:hypothetical protein HanIR_Chr12g0567191 [Helianthus annuus]|nr:hypothetical protein HanIR_Chr12g0567191 [Helianthus annuus]
MLVREKKKKKKKKKKLANGASQMDRYRTGTDTENTENLEMWVPNTLANLSVRYRYLLQNALSICYWYRKYQYRIFGKVGTEYLTKSISTISVLATKCSLYMVLVPKIPIPNFWKSGYRIPYRIRYRYWYSVPNSHPWIESFLRVYF